MAQQATMNPAGAAAAHAAAPAVPRVLTTAAALVFLGGLLAAATGAYFVVGAHPFHRAGEFAKEFGMTRAQVDAFNPEISRWVVHVSDQVGAVSFGWGAFLMVLAATGLRRGDRATWWALLAGGLPTLLMAAFGEVVAFGTLDTGSVLSIAVLVAFLAGMLLAAPVALRGRSPDAG